MHNLLKSILAGMAVSLGGVAYLSNENSIIGAILFSIGLVMIYLFDWCLYTGKACYAVVDMPNNLSIIGVAFIGNLIGTMCVAYTLRMTKLAKLIPHAEEVVAGKLQNTLFSGFILAIGCGILMYVAVIGYKTVPSDLGKYITLIMPVVVFTISGFEHVVANMFYFSMANAWNIENFFYIIIVALGNLVGCSIVPLSDKYFKIKEHA
ncbi:MAG: formate/nitrite transporter family protein [Clostridia bacterium]